MISVRDARLYMSCKIYLTTYIAIFTFTLLASMRIGKVIVHILNLVHTPFVNDINKGERKSRGVFVVFVRPKIRIGVVGGLTGDSKVVSFDWHWPIRQGLAF